MLCVWLVRWHDVHGWFILLVGYPPAYGLIQETQRQEVIEYGRGTLPF